MKRTSIFSYFAFGYDYRTTRYDWTTRTCADSIEKIKSYLDELSTLGLPITSSIVKDLSTHSKELSKLDKTSIIPSSKAKEISEIIERADPALDAELQQKKVLSTTPKRFDVDVLIDSPESLLSPSSWELMSEQAKRDYKSACLCISFSVATAAAFHIMRCTEEMVKMLYYCFVKTNRLTKPMWGPMTDKLRRKNKPKPTNDLLDHLDTIRKNFRNPTQHPEKFYTIDEAQDLLFASIVAINRVCAAIAAKK